MFRRRNGFVRGTTRNVVLNVATRFQNRRRRKGRKIRARNLAVVPRAQQGMFYRVPQPRRRAQVVAPKHQVYTRAAAVGTGLSDMQPAVSRRENGTENLCQLTTDSSHGTGFTILQNVSLNPAEPRLAPALSAIANQYQRFKFNCLSFTYTPVCATSTTGTVYFGIQPDPQAAAPTSVEDMKRLFGAQQMTVYGEPFSWQISLENLQQAYRVLQIQVSEDSTEDTTLVSAGALYIACDGAPISTRLGTLDWTYSVDLSLQQLTTAPNTLFGHYTASGAALGSLAVVVVQRTDLTSGYHTLISTATPGVYAVRDKSSPHILVLRGTATTGAFSSVVTESQDGGLTFGAALAPAFEFTTGADYCRVYITAPCTHLGLAYNTTRTVTAQYVFIAGLRNK